MPRPPKVSRLETFYAEHLTALKDELLPDEMQHAIQLQDIRAITLVNAEVQIRATGGRQSVK